MFLFTMFASAIALVFVLHALVLRKAFNEHDELMALSVSKDEGEH